MASMVTKREFERLAKAAFRAMPTLYDPSDSVVVVATGGGVYSIGYLCELPATKVAGVHR